MNDGELIAQNVPNEDNILNSRFLIKNAIEPRDYQINIAAKCIGNNFLVIIPTGLGKTIIAALVTAKTLELYPDDSKIIIMAPTKPLIVQHAQSFADFLNIKLDSETSGLEILDSERESNYEVDQSIDETLNQESRQQSGGKPTNQDSIKKSNKKKKSQDSIKKSNKKINQDSSQNQNYVLTGSVDPKERVKIFLNSRILYYTPQTLRNDLLKQRYDLKKVALIIFDEAHRASGDYAYCEIAEYYKEMNPDGNVLALTASPGSNREKIETLCRNLNIPMNNIEMRDRNDGDVKPFLHDMKILKIGVEMNKLMSEILGDLRDLSDEKLTLLAHLGIIDSNRENIQKLTQKSLVMLNKDILTKIKDMKNTPVRERTESDKNLYTALSVNAEAMRIMHMFNLAETQGADILLNYFLDMRKEAAKPKVSKAVQNLIVHPIFLKILNRLLSAKSINEDLLIHPKFFKLRDILELQFKQDSNSRVLVFTQLRNTAKNLTDRLNKVEGFRAIRFVGQATKSASDTGLSQKKQIEIIDKFKSGKYNILVSTNVAEEGLDIAECDLVVFYDTVASEIRLIQRRGRIARKRDGKVIILYCIGTSDEKYLNISMQRLKKMHNILDKSRSHNSTKRITEQKRNQKLLDIHQSKQLPQSNNQQKLLEPQRFPQSNNQQKLLDPQQSPLSQQSKHVNTKNEKKKGIIKINRMVPTQCRLLDFFSSLGYFVKKENPITGTIRFLRPDIYFEDSLVITIIKPENMERILYLINPKLSQEPKKEILEEAEYFKHNWKIGMIFIDFIGQNGYNLAEKQQIIKDYEKFTSLTKIEVIPIDSPEDMFIILSSLLESIGKTL